ncbi:hypothetical protein BP6252_07603 [Coleophoma cylindrospora]|uniref:G-protein coupled receptors family 2 profile 2 domain-containing protein n=1 Tax=Coleophoma cylindrospora TaxID=1849047 RepID=A0A3D8RAN4_9HELO|nr:hypothetical protein BP6252_07603 [Coleophoma cylindrospora]
MNLLKRTATDEISEAQLHALVVVERVGSSLSLIGCIFIIVSFLMSKAFHKPINRLVFYASIGNIMSNIATIIARASLGSLGSFLCQFQGFLIQMFMPADAYWTLAMACNVYLTFYFKFDAPRLRKMEPVYIACCYGIPFIPAFIYIWIKTSENGRFYGNATLWCWVANNWDIWRILTFYGPVWIVIFITVAIYLRAGVEIYKRRKQLQYFSQSALETLPQVENPFKTMKTTEISVTSEAIDTSDTIDLHQLGRPQKPNPGGYSVSISTSQPMGDQSPPSFTEKVPPLPTLHLPEIHPLSLSPIQPTTSSAAQPPFVPPEFPERSHAPPAKRRAAVEANSAAWGYTKVALLFFTAMLVTWIPSSANRLYSLVHPGQVSIPLEFASALVLPLQGFWNAVIYITTSRQACKAFMGHLFSRHRVSTRPVTQLSNLFNHESKGPRRMSSALHSLDNESMTELTSRPTASH